MHHHSKCMLCHHTTSSQYICRRMDHTLEGKHYHQPQNVGRSCALQKSCAFQEPHENTSDISSIHVSLILLSFTKGLEKRRQVCRFAFPFTLRPMLFSEWTIVHATNINGALCYRLVTPSSQFYVSIDGATTFCVCNKVIDYHLR